jgi:hypothetical protein
MADNSVFIAGVASGSFKDAFEGIEPWAKEKTLSDVRQTLLDILSAVKKGGVGGGGGDSSGNSSKTLAELIRELDKTKQDQANDLKNAKELLRGTVLSFAIYLKKNLYNVLKENVNTFDMLYQGGINVAKGFEYTADGFKSVQQLAVITGVRFTELRETLVKYNTAVNVFGLGRFVRTLSASAKELQKFGFTTKQSAEVLGAYLESQRGFTDINAKTQEEVQSDMVKFGQRIDRLSKVTGVATTKLLEDIKAISQSVEANILYGQTSADATQNTLEFIASFKDKKLGQDFLRMMTDAIKPLNQTFQTFQKLGFGGFAQKMSAFANGLKGLSGPEAAKAKAEFVRANRAQIQAMMQQANLYRQTNLAGEAEAALSTLTALTQEERAYADVSEEQRSINEKAAEASAKLRTAFENLVAQLQRFVAPLTLVMDFISSGLNMFNNFLDSIRKFVVGANESGRAFDIAAVMAIIAGFVASLWGASKAIILATRVIRGATGGAGAAGGAAGAAGSAAGRGPGRLGGFLESLGSARALMGSLTLTLLAANIYIAAKGFQEFATIEWDSIGKGFVALAGLGAVSAALGAFLPVVGPGVVALGLLGVALIPFAYAAKLAGEGMIMLGTGFESIVKSINSLGDISRFKELVETVNKIDVVKAGAFALISRIANPSSSSVDTSQSGKSAQSVDSRAESLAKNAVESQKGSAGESSSINSLLVQQNSLIESLLTSTNNLVSVNNEILRYTKARV